MLNVIPPSKKPKYSPRTKYLPLSGMNHPVEIKDLSPERLKKLAWSYKKSKKLPGSHTTTLNKIAKSLGFKGGWSEFSEASGDGLISFMKMNGLEKRVDLCSVMQDGGVFVWPTLNIRDISERLFSESELPRKIFTGYDFDFSILNQVDNPWLFSGVTFPGELSFWQGKDRNSAHGGSHRLISTQISKAIEYLKCNVGATVECSGGEVDLILLFIEILKSHISSCLNVVGGNLTDLYLDEETVIASYNPGMDESGFFDDIEIKKAALSVYRLLIERSNLGWVEVIPYNEHLMFLKGNDGGYDFVVKGERDYSFSNSPSQETSIVMTPEGFDYQNWLYFTYDGFLDRDRHEAEKHYYASGNDSSAYPGQNVILESYHKHIGAYVDSYSYKSNEILSGFKEVHLQGKRLMVSELITSKELFDDLSLSGKCVDDWGTIDSLKEVNDEKSPLPVASTLIDARKYLSWFKKKNNIAVRLLMSEEILELISLGGLYRPDSGGVDEYKRQNFSVDFDDLSYTPSKHCLVHSVFFAEWTQEGSCVRTGNSKSFYGDDFILRSKPPENSTGAYKKVRIGFRLCYEIE